MPANSIFSFALIAGSQPRLLNEKVAEPKRAMRGGPRSSGSDGGRRTAWTPQRRKVVCDSCCRWERSARLAGRRRSPPGHTAFVVRASSVPSSNREGRDALPAETEASTAARACPRSTQRAIGKAQTVRACLELVEAHSTFLDDVHVASLFNRVADLRRFGAGAPAGAAEEASLGHLIELVKLRLPSMNPRSLSTVANACGKLSFAEGESHHDRAAVHILGLIRARVNASLTDFTALDLENVVWAHGKHKVRVSPEELDVWFWRLGETIECLSTRGLVSLLYTLQVLRYRPHSEVLAALGRATALHAPAMSLRDLANVLSSLAHLRRSRSCALELTQPTAAVTRAISDKLEAARDKSARSGGRGPGLNLRNIANLLWSFALLQCYPEEEVLVLLDELAAPLMGSREATPLVVNTYLRASHKLARKPADRVLESALALVGKTLGEGDLKQACRLVKSLVMLNFEVPRDYLGAMEAGLVAASGEGEGAVAVGLDPVTMHDALWALATAGFEISPDYRELALRFAEEKAETFRTGPGCRIFWSMAMLGIPLDDESEGPGGLISRMGMWEDGRRVSHSVGLLLWAMRSQKMLVRSDHLERAKAHVERNWDVMTPTEILCLVDVLFGEGAIDADDADWIANALNRARTVVIR